MNAKMRAWWFEKQGLAGMAGTPRDVLNRSGWARSVGGANPYVSIFARSGARQAAIDAAAIALDIHELPSARGCTYVVPEDDYALALTVASGDDPAINTAKRYLGVTDDELDRLSDGVVLALSSGALEPRQIMSAVGGLARNLGEEGKKRGQTTTLPLALGRLQVTGRIRRLPVNGRLDQQRYAYALWPKNPLDGFGLGKEQAFVELGRKYWKWIGPARVGDFQWFSGLGVNAAGSAVAALNLEDLGDGWLISAEEVGAYENFKAPPEPSYALISAIDALFLLRRDIGAHMAPEDLEQKMMTDKGPTVGRGLKDLEHHAIVDRGRIVGFWEFDPSANEVVWKAFGKPDQDLRGAIRQMEEFAREMGDVRSFSLDSPESRKPKIEFLRS